MCFVYACIYVKCVYKHTLFLQAALSPAVTRRCVEGSEGTGGGVTRCCCIAPSPPNEEGFSLSTAWTWQEGPTIDDLAMALETGVLCLILK